MISDFEKQARRMDLSRVKFYRLNYTGNSKLKQELSEDLGVPIETATFLLFRDGQVIFKRHEELIDMERLMKKLFDE
jgi:hypothetical protein